MESDTIITFSLIGVGIYAIYKIFNNSGIQKTTDAIGDVAQAGAGIITSTTDLFKDPNTAGYAIGSAGLNIATNYGKGQVGFATGLAESLVNTSSKLFNTKSVDQMKIAQNAANAPVVMTNIGISSDGGLFSSAKPLVANTTTKYGAAAQQSARGTGLFKGATVRNTTTRKYSNPY